MIRKEASYMFIADGQGEDKCLRIVQFPRNEQNKPRQSYIVSVETELTRGFLPGIHNRDRGFHTDHHDVP